MINVYNITFQQTDRDIHELVKSINRTLPRNERAKYFNDLSDADIIEYLMRWHQDDLEWYESSLQFEADIDTKFLGYRIDQDNEDEGYLFNRHNGLEYVGLSYFKKERTN